MVQANYDRYFQEHYGLEFSARDIAQHRAWFHAQWKVINRRVRIDCGKSMLEIGSGVGGLYSFLGAADYVGLELDGKAAAFANSYFGKPLFTQQRFEAYESPRRVDYIFAFEVLEHLADPSAAIAKIKTQLTAGGAFIGTTPYPFRRNVVGDATHVSVLHPLNWHRLFALAGFRHISLTPMSFAPGLWRLSPHLNLRLPFYVPLLPCVSTCLIIARA